MKNIRTVRVVLDELYTAQLGAMADFYCRYLGLKRGPVTRDPNGARQKLTSSQFDLLLVEKPGGKCDGPAFRLCVEFGTGHELHDLIRAIPKDKPPVVSSKVREDQEEFNLVLKDPDGNLIQMHQCGEEYWGRNLSG